MGCSASVREQRSKRRDFCSVAHAFDASGEENCPVIRTLQTLRNALLAWSYCLARARYDGSVSCDVICEHQSGSQAGASPPGHRLSASAQRGHGSEKKTQWRANGKKKTPPPNKNLPVPTNKLHAWGSPAQPLLLQYILKMTIKDSHLLMTI